MLKKSFCEAFFDAGLEKEIRNFKRFSQYKDGSVSFHSEGSGLEVHYDESVDLWASKREDYDKYLRPVLKKLNDRWVTCWCYPTYDEIHFDKWVVLIRELPFGMSIFSNTKRISIHSKNGRLEFVDEFRSVFFAKKYEEARERAISMLENREIDSLEFNDYLKSLEIGTRGNQMSFTDKGVSLLIRNEKFTPLIEFLQSLEPNENIDISPFEISMESLFRLEMRHREGESDFVVQFTEDGVTVGLHGVTAYMK